MGRFPVNSPDFHYKVTFIRHSSIYALQRIKIHQIHQQHLTCGMGALKCYAQLGIQSICYIVAFYPLLSAFPRSVGLSHQPCIHIQGCWALVGGLLIEFLTS